MYRRSEEELPAREEEVRHAVEEGVAFDFLVSPVELLGDNGWLTGARLQRMELGEPDESGRRRPKPIEGDLIEVPVDMAVVAIGNAPNPLLLSTVPELEQTSRGTLAIDEETGATSLPGVFAGGDIVTGGATVISAMGAARKAAAAIDAYLREPALT
jgi:glutamate synthase (NADPH/NADH) small chain